MTPSHESPQTPYDLLPIEAALDALAESERAAAPAALDDRIFVATRAGLAGVEQPLVITIRRSTIGRLRVAAAVAIVGIAGALYLARQGQQPANTEARLASLERLESDLDFILAMHSSDDSLRSTSDSIDSLFLETLNLGASLRQGSIAPLGEEGSI